MFAASNTFDTDVDNDQQGSGSSQLLREFIYQVTQIVGINKRAL